MQLRQNNMITNPIGLKIKDFCKNAEEIVLLLVVAVVGDLHEQAEVNLLLIAK